MLIVQDSIPKSKNAQKIKFRFIALSIANNLPKKCHSERSAEGAKSKNLRIIIGTEQLFGAKILRLHFVPLRMTHL